MNKLEKLNKQVESVRKEIAAARALRDSIFEEPITARVLFDDGDYFERIHHKVDGVSYHFDHKLDADIVSHLPNSSSVRKMQEDWRAADIADTAGVRKLNRLIHKRSNEQLNVKIEVKQCQP